MDHRNKGVSYRYTPKPTHKALRIHEKRSKRHSSLLIQMRTENIGLKDLLYQREVPEITGPHCVCGEGRQKVMHVLMRCRRFNDLRRQELSRIPRRSNLRAILNERKTGTKAIGFMEQTQIPWVISDHGIDRAKHWGETEGRSMQEG